MEGRVIIVILMVRANIPYCKESDIEALINGCAARGSVRQGHTGEAARLYK